MPFRNLLNQEIVNEAVDTIVGEGRDTRDKVIHLHARLEDLERRMAAGFKQVEDRSATNGKILEELHDAYRAGQAYGQLGTVMFRGGRMLLAGGTGAALWAWLSSWPWPHR